MFHVCPYCDLVVHNGLYVVIQHECLQTAALFFLFTVIFYLYP